MEYLEDLTVRELFSSFNDTKEVAEIFIRGIAMTNHCLALPAMEEMLRRRDSNMVAAIIGLGIEDKVIRRDDVFSALMIEALVQNRYDETFGTYGRALRLKARVHHDFVTPEQWAAEHGDGAWMGLGTPGKKTVPDWAKASLTILPDGEVRESRLKWQRDKKLASELVAKFAKASD